MGSLLIILIILRMNKEKVNIFHISLMSIILKLKIIIPTMSGHDHSGFTIPIVGHLRTQMTKYHSLFIENLSTNFQRGLRIRVFFNFILSLLRVITLILNKEREFPLWNKLQWNPLRQQSCKMLFNPISLCIHPMQLTDIFIRILS